MNTKELESLDYPKKKNDSPNQNTMFITEIRGLLSQITEKLSEIHVKTDKQTACKRIAIDEIDLFERTTLYGLQVSFE